MRGFFFRLIPPRPSFAFDMSSAERDTMLEHVGYWSKLAEEGVALVFGPVDDPSGGYGIGVILAEDLTSAEVLRDHDPAVRSPHGFQTVILPVLQLVTQSGKYPDHMG